MLKNYLITICRSVTRQKTYSLINILGLATAMACCIMLGMFIRHELSFESFHENRDTLYRVLAEVSLPWSDKQSINRTPPAMAAEMKADFPEVANATNIGLHSAAIRYDDLFFEEDRFYFADPEFLEMFTFPLLKGDAAKSLSEPYCVLVTESTAAKLFGDEEPVGKVIRFGTVFELTVTGVLKDIPEDSHIQIDYLASQSTARNYWGGQSGHQGIVGKGNAEWGKLYGPTYFQLQAGVDKDLFQERFSVWTDSHFPDGEAFPFTIQPIKAIRFHGHASAELETNTDLDYVYFIAAMALLILLIASFNYVNLATARAVDRSREAAVRKILGASRSQVIQRFLYESMIMAGLALVLAVGLVYLWLPIFSELVGVELSFSPAGDSLLVVGLVVCAGLVGLLAGVYPAFFLSSAKPVDAVKGGTIISKRGTPYLRNGLATFQYLVSVGLIVCTVVVYQQLDYIGTRDLGYTTEDVVSFQVKEFRLKKSYQSLKTSLEAIPGVTAVSGSLALPTDQPAGASACWWEGKDVDAPSFYLHWSTIDEDFLSFYDIPLTAGRDFSIERASDKKDAYILNEAAVRACGWDEPIGKNFGLSHDGDGRVIGVVKDFHFESLHKKVEPLAFKFKTGKPRRVSMKISPDQVTVVLDQINTLWKGYSSRPLKFSFMDERVAESYSHENRLQQVFGYSAILTLAIAGLGLGGLAAYTTEQRRKEIGVRKVLGSSSVRIATLLIRQFVRWVAIANLIACPLAYYVMKGWLVNFAYRIELGWEPFVLTAIVTMIVAVTTVCYQAVKAARANPVEALKYE